MRYKIQQLSEEAITVKFGDFINDTVHEKVMWLYRELHQNPFDGLLDTVPSYNSITLFYDAFKIYEAEKTSPLMFVKDYLEKLLSSGREEEVIPGDTIKIPVCFEKKFAPDLSLISADKNLSEEEVIEIFCGRSYKVYMIGFAPGFPYMGIVDKRIAMPRKETPRLRVEAGSVGIAGNQTGIYPFQTPGGWQLIGRSPVKLFDVNLANPSLLKAGDRVKFHRISAEEFLQEFHSDQ
jgi:inhibitor of KinA